MVDFAIFCDRDNEFERSRGFGIDYNNTSKRPYSKPSNPSVSKEPYDCSRSQHWYHEKQQNGRRLKGHNFQRHQKQQYSGRPGQNYGYPPQQYYQGQQGYCYPHDVATNHHRWQNQYQPSRSNFQPQFQRPQSWMGQNRNGPYIAYNNGYVNTASGFVYETAPSQQKQQQQQQQQRQQQQRAVPRQYFTTIQPALNSYETVKTPEPKSPEASIPLQLNVKELYEKLEQSGILNVLKNTKQSGELKETKANQIKKEEKISFNNPESIKTKHPNLFTILYEGNPCSSCGLRFRADETNKYRQHLDWHFRENKREKELKKKTLSRGWYFVIRDWHEHEATEDLDEQQPNFFETQMMAKMEAEVKEEEVPRVLAGSEDNLRCEVCRDTFEIYFDDDEENWYILPAVKFQDVCLHPPCVEDYQKMLTRGDLDSSFDDTVESIDI